MTVTVVNKIIVEGGSIAVKIEKHLENDTIYSFFDATHEDAFSIKGKYFFEKFASNIAEILNEVSTYIDLDFILNYEECGLSTSHHTIYNIYRSLSNTFRKL